MARPSLCIGLQVAYLATILLCRFLDGKQGRVETGSEWTWNLWNRPAKAAYGIVAIQGDKTMTKL